MVERSHAEFCENGAKHVADEATTKRVTPEFFREWSVADLADSQIIGSASRDALRIPWCFAEERQTTKRSVGTMHLALIAGELNSLGHPDEAIFYTSGRTSNEAAFLYQLFVRLFGTNNLPDCSNMCHESSGSALE